MVKVKDVYCYGYDGDELSDDDNFSCAFEDPEEDFIWCDRDPDEQPTWESIVDEIQSYAASKLLELQAI